MNKYKQSIDSTLHIPEFKGVNSGGGNELITLSDKDVKKSYIDSRGVYYAIVDEPDILIALHGDYGMFYIAEGLSVRKEDYSFDTYVEHFIKTFPFLDKVASTIIETLTQPPGFSEAPEDEKILAFLQYIINFLRFYSKADTPSAGKDIMVCSSDLFDIFKTSGVSITETEETREFLVLAPKCHNLRDAFYFFAGL